MSKSLRIFFIFFIGVAATTSGFNLESRYEDQVDIDPYRYTKNEEIKLINWYMDLNKQLLSDEMLAFNTTLPGSKNNPEQFMGLVTTLDWDSWSVSFANKLPLTNDRMKVPFFDSWDIDPKNPKAVATLEEVRAFRNFLDKVWIKTYHRNAAEGEKPGILIGQSAEDDLEYIWPKRHLGPKDNGKDEAGGIFLSIFPKGVQFFKLIHDLEVVFADLDSAQYESLKTSNPKINFPSFSKFKSGLDELIDGGKRFLVGFVMHETYHANQFNTVPVRNIANPVDNSGKLVDGLFEDFGFDFITGTIGSAGGIDKYIADSVVVAKKQLKAIRAVLKTDKNSADRKQKVQSLEAAFPLVTIDDISTYNAFGKEKLWQQIASDIISTKSLFWDSLVKSEIYEEIEGFGLNRVLLKGHEVNLRDFAYFVQFLRTDEIKSDPGNLGEEFERMETFGRSAQGAFALKLATSGLREKFTGPASDGSSVAHMTKAAPFNLLRWDADFASDVGGNDSVGYYMMWDSYMAWLGTTLEPPVSDLLRGHWMSILINHRLVEISQSLSLSPDDCNAELVKEYTGLTEEGHRFLNPDHKSKVNIKLVGAYPEFEPMLEVAFSKLEKLANTIKSKCHLVE